ncbi:hypothetical protein H6P81_009222 [Aristolochia fimbriata]|uniref:HMA domain-containing protein n=1 Tax=Aristolochia fimbriata TaxID=158543 RepID=A0AAV7EK88_ARIFI|nr:hypothetical protein H6P81_009222 [Aristolochia fimbriata]
MATENQKQVTGFQKSYFDVIGVCCSSEVTLIEKILKPLEGVQEVSVIIPSRTVIVVHDNLLVSQTQIVKALNQARLDANIRVFGQEKKGISWPSPYTMASLVLLVISAFQWLYHPLKWFALAAAIVGLPPVLMRSLAAIWRLTLDINTLALIAVAVSLALRDFWEAGLLVFLFTFAVWLECRASHKATAAMSSLMSMAPQKAVLAENGQVVEAKDVKVNTILAVKAGEVIPIDGVVVEGNSEVDEKSLTGESFPVAKQTDSVVWAGTINLTGYISVKTTTLSDDTAVAKMAKLVEEAQSSKSKTQRLIDSCAKYYTPTVVVVAIGVAVVPVAMRVHNIRHWLHLALVFLVSTCPCALVLSTPVATYCALTKAAAFGLLVKGGDYLEALAKIKVIAFDKTGTITKGEFSVTEFRGCHNVSEETLLYWVSSIESKSSHPMAGALVEYSRSNGVEPRPDEVKEFENFPGEGIYGEIDGKTIYIGNKKIAARVKCSSVPAMEGTTIGYVFLESTPVGVFSLSDTCRIGVAKAIRELKHLGLKTAMLTGDSNAAAMYIQHQLGQAIEMVHAELLPEEKVAFIKELKTKFGPTKVSVIVPSRTVIVVHDTLLVSQTQIVKALNQARLDANIQVFGEEKRGISWPSPYTMASLLLLVISAFQWLYHPLKWFAVAAAIVGLPPILMRSLTAIWRLTLDINILVFIAVAGSLALRDFWEAGLLVFLFTFAVWLESRASHKATAAMSSLMSMAPQKAVLAENGQVVEAKDVKVNTVLAVKAGEVIPIDGVVVEGKSEVDEKSLTGESFPVAKQIDSVVWAGTINLTGYISVKTTTLSEDTAVAKMAKLVEEAQSSKSKTQRLIDSCAKYYTPTVLVVAIGVAVVPVAMRVHNLRHWLHLALVFLVSACPCALVLSTPVATYCALTKAASFGLLVKGGDYLEALAKIKVIAFDKTGTITKGEFSVTEFRGCHNVNKETLLHWVSSIESKSSHPMAAALVEYSRSNGVEPRPDEVKEFEIFPGEGIYGEIDGKTIYIGNKKIASRVKCSSVPAMEGTTIGYVFLESTPVGVFSLSDTCRIGVVQAIRELKHLGLKTAMLTGDSNAAAMYIQHQLGQAIEMVHAELLPEEKVAFIKELKTKFGPTGLRKRRKGMVIVQRPMKGSSEVIMLMNIPVAAATLLQRRRSPLKQDRKKRQEGMNIVRPTMKFAQIPTTIRQKISPMSMIILLRLHARGRIGIDAAKGAMSIPSQSSETLKEV